MCDGPRQIKIPKRPWTTKVLWAQHYHVCRLVSEAWVWIPCRTLKKISILPNTSISHVFCNTDVVEVSSIRNVMQHQRQDMNMQNYFRIRFIKIYRQTNLEHTHCGISAINLTIFLFHTLEWKHLLSKETIVTVNE